MECECLTASKARGMQFPYRGRHKWSDHKSRNPNGNGQCPVLRWMVCDSYGMEGIVRDVGPEDVENCRDYEECDGCVGEDEHPSQFATRRHNRSNGAYPLAPKLSRPPRTHRSHPRRRQLLSFAPWDRGPFPSWPPSAS
mmetsp:Transcript_4336/g.11220  ORF Transcript_4336/g.11220 Transcript_4336/m.11220 type:complete len:139 (+) Transcript_4336:197-613(+)